jgi:hypothetical protein
MGAPMTTAPSLPHRWCANCAILLGGPVVRGADGLPYCCDGCAVGGPCTCAYEQVWDELAGASRQPERREGVGA